MPTAQIGYLSRIDSSILNRNCRWFNQFRSRMAGLEEAISTKDPEVIKKKRSTILRMITAIHNNMAKLLEKTSGRFDHNKIQRTRVLTDLASLKKYQESFEMIHVAYMDYREEGKDATEEESLAAKQEK